jgi:carbon monoxide dehydrogenase subunit G
MPGCEKIEPSAEPNSYDITLTVGIGAIKGVYAGKIRLEDIQPPSHYKMIVEGKGSPGFVKGEGELDLTEADGTTTISYRGDIQIGGMLASVGQRMIQSSSKMIIGQFFTAIEAEAASAPDSSPPKHGFFRNLLRAIWKRIKGGVS